MSTKLIVRNLPQNLNQGSFISAFSDLRGFLNGSLLFNPQNELYGIVDFADYGLADFARKNRANFKFPGSSHPIIIDFFKPQESYDYPSGPAPINAGYNIGNAPLVSMNNPQAGMNLQGQPNQGLFMQHQPNNDMLNMMNQLTSAMQAQVGNFPFQQNPNQFMQQGMNNPNPGLNMGPQPAINSNLVRIDPNLNDQNIRNFPQMPLNNAMSSFTQMLSQMPFNKSPNTQQFNGPQGGQNMNFQNMQNKPNLNEDIVMFKTPSKATNSIYVDGVPIDATEREVAHVFRPYPGFKEVRLIKKEAKNGRKFYFCFVDFENSLQSTIALHTLQGYKFDKSDKKGLKITYAFHAQGSSKHQQHQQQNKNFKLKRRN